VKNQPRSHKLLNASLSRREFLGQSAAAAMGFTIVPRRVLGGTGYVPPSDKDNIAFIGIMRLRCVQFIDRTTFRCGYAAGRDSNPRPGPVHTSIAVM
jgi:hypothetical protein